MRRNWEIGLVIFSCIWVAAAAGMGTQLKQQELLIFRVKDHQVGCDGYEGTSRCYMVQKGAAVGSDNWEVLREPIEGFRYEEGYTYDVKVRMELVPNPDTDQSRYRYQLVETLSKTKTP